MDSMTGRRYGRALCLEACVVTGQRSNSAEKKKMILCICAGPDL